MKKKFTRILKISIPLLLGVFLVWYSLGKSTDEERELLWSNIKGANFQWILVSFFLGSFSHLLRAHRWKYMLEPMGYSSNLANRFMAVMAGYLANFGIPRSGEVLRAVSLSTYEDVPFEKGFGTIISERVADLLMLMLIIGIALLVQTDELLAYLDDQNINPLYTFLIFSGLVGITVLGLNIVRKSTWSLFAKLRKIARGMLEGMKSILNMRQKWSFIFYTILIWTLYLLMFFVIKWSVPGTISTPFGVTLAAFIVGSFAVSATNGGIGVYPLAVAGILIFFGIDNTSAEAFGWISWATQTAVVLLFGGLSFILLPLLNNRK